MLNESISRADIDGFDIIVSINNQDEILHKLNEIENKVKRANERLAKIPNIKQEILDKYLK
jgi:hypothetical protein